MGWGELRAWLAVRTRQLEEAAKAHEPDPDRWTPASRDNFADLDAKRRQMRGR